LGLRNEQERRKRKALFHPITEDLQQHNMSSSKGGDFISVMEAAEVWGGTRSDRGKGEKTTFI